MLKDRISLNQGNNQKYGTQLFLDTITNVYYVCPLENPDKVDKWRKKVGLPPIQILYNEVNQIWDIEEYKKELPEIEKKFFQNKY